VAFICRIIALYNEWKVDGEEGQLPISCFQRQTQYLDFKKKGERMKMSFANWDEIIELCGCYSTKNPAEEKNTSMPKKKPQQVRAAELIAAEKIYDASSNDGWTEETYDNMLDRKYGINVFSTPIT
jgi:hypothetical protein